MAISVTPDLNTYEARRSQMFEHLVCEAVVEGLVTNNRQTAFILSSATSHFTRILFLNERREGTSSIRIYGIWHIYVI